VTVGDDVADCKTVEALRFGLSCVRTASHEVSTPTGKESGELRLCVDVVSPSTPGLVAVPPQAETRETRDTRAERHEAARKEVRRRVMPGHHRKRCATRSTGVPAETQGEEAVPS
jgi:hypothetical protein